MLDAYKAYLNHKLRSLRRDRREAEPPPPPPPPRGVFGRLFGGPDEDSAALREGFTEFIYGGREGLDDEIRRIEAELARLNSGASWTRDEIELRLDQLRRSRKGLDGGREQLRSFAKFSTKPDFLDALLGTFSDVATAGLRERLDAAIDELENYRKRAGEMVSSSTPDAKRAAKLGELADFCQRTFGDTKLTFEAKKLAAGAEARVLLGQDWVNDPQVRELFSRFGVPLDTPQVPRRW
jgi:hypothetical protein